MSSSTKLAKSFTIDREVEQYVNDTKGSRSASERVNELLTAAIRQEQYAKFEAEAEAFFCAAGDRERKETQALQVASIRAITRD